MESVDDERLTKNEFIELIPHLPLGDVLRIECLLDSWSKMIQIKDQYKKLYLCTICNIVQLGQKNLFLHIGDKKHNSKVHTVKQLFHPEYTYPKEQLKTTVNNKNADAARQAKISSVRVITKPTLQPSDNAESKKVLSTKTTTGSVRQSDDKTKDAKGTLKGPSNTFTAVKIESNNAKQTTENKTSKPATANKNTNSEGQKSSSKITPTTNAAQSKNNVNVTNATSERNEAQKKGQAGTQKENAAMSSTKPKPSTTVTSNPNSQTAAMTSTAKAPATAISNAKTPTPGKSTSKSPTVVTPTSKSPTVVTPTSKSPTVVTPSSKVPPIPTKTPIAGKPIQTVVTNKLVAAKLTPKMLSLKVRLKDCAKGNKGIAGAGKTTTTSNTATSKKPNPTKHGEMQNADKSVSNNDGEKKESSQLVRNPFAQISDEHEKKIADYGSHTSEVSCEEVVSAPEEIIIIDDDADAGNAGTNEKTQNLVNKDAPKGQTSPSKHTKIVKNPAAAFLVQASEDDSMSHENGNKKPRYQSNVVIIPTVRGGVQKVPISQINQPKFSTKTFSSKPSDNDEHGLIGVEYVIKILRHRQDNAPKYECGLCELVLDGPSMQNHLVGYNHRLKFCERHFPTAIRQFRQYMGELEQHEIYKVMTPILIKLAIAIEQHHGRDLPYECLEQDFNINRHEIISRVFSCRHASEQYGPTFTHIISSKEIDELVANRHNYKPHSVAQETIFDIRPGDVAANRRQKKRKFPTQRDQQQQLAGRNLMPVQSQNIYQKVIQPQYQMQMPQYISQPQPHPQPQRFQGPVVDNETHKLMVEDFLRGTQPRNTARERERRSRQSRSNERTRKRTRSRSLSNSRQRRKSLSPLRDNDIWQAYRHLVDQKLNELEDSFILYKKDPETHPLYNEEWEKFWKHRKDALIAEGIDHRTYNYQPEWVIFFEKRIEELHDIAIENAKIIARERLCLPMTNHQLSNPKYHVHVMESPIEGISQNISSKRSDSNLETTLKRTMDSSEPPEVVAVLRLMTALEDLLGSLGPKIIDLLSIALQTEKTHPEKVNAIVLTSENCSLLETAMEKFKGLLMAGLMEGSKERALQKAVHEINALLKLAPKVQEKASLKKNGPNAPFKANRVDLHSRNIGLQQAQQLQPRSQPQGQQLHPRSQQQAQQLQQRSQQQTQQLQPRYFPQAQQLQPSSQHQAQQFQPSYFPQAQQLQPRYLPQASAQNNQPVAMQSRQQIQNSSHNQIMPMCHQTIRVQPTAPQLSPPSPPPPPSPPSPPEVSNPVGRIDHRLDHSDKKELAEKLAAVLSSQGKTDCDLKELEQLIVAYSLLEKKKREAAEIAKPSTAKVQQKALSDTLSDLLNTKVGTSKVNTNSTFENRNCTNESITKYVDMMRNSTDVNVRSTNNSYSEPRGANVQNFQWNSSKNYQGNTDFRPGSTQFQTSNYGNSHNIQQNIGNGGANQFNSKNSTMNRANFGNNYMPNERSTINPRAFGPNTFNNNNNSNNSNNNSNNSNNSISNNNSSVSNNNYRNNDNNNRNNNYNNANFGNMTSFNSGRGNQQQQVAQNISRQEQTATGLNINQPRNQNWTASSRGRPSLNEGRNTRNQNIADVAGGHQNNKWHLN